MIMYSAYTVKKLPRRKQKKSICLTFVEKIMQIAHKDSDKREETGKIEQKLEGKSVYEKKKKQ